ncbi:MAG: mucD [Hydrocarboniphaga sp.]|uniref:DegQ family serine endoprotease n=1 Tax=Hydrocarboniphaga sp. TaxID=2033016 RepID=UPI00262FFFD4|nr:DegQ family serine endoprotease [Hydrocarboniphaga sp.]MDB5969822.1 mucD [Hydrocarboniphaga sp.]
MSLKFVRNPFAAALLGAAVIGVPATIFAMGHEAAPVVPVAAPIPQSTSVIGRAALPDFSAMVRAYGPAVVNITTKGLVKTSARSGQLRGMPGFGDDDDDSPFGQFFRQFPQQQIPDSAVRGEGSGFILGADGIILTNAHVVADAKEVTVKLTDKREFTAKVIGQDTKSDIAVLKIDAHDLPTVKVGDPSQLEVGEWVVAIGSPFGFENSVTQGIVSAKGRTLPDGSYVPFLQTDVAINPGNSGGPLFNLDGEVVGINSQIYTRSGGFQGVSFSIPIDVAMNVTKQLQATGHVSRGKLGVTIQAVTQDLAKSFGLDKPQGALVSNVEKDSPAERAGIEPGDVIVKLDGKTIDETAELPAAVAAMQPGSKIKLTVWREGREKELSAKLDEMTDKQVASADEGDSAAASGKLGMAVRPLTPDEQKQVEVKGGLLVQDVAAAAAEAGIRPGDIVLSANGKPIDSVKQLRDITAKADRHIALLIQRGEARIFVPVDLS